MKCSSIFELSLECLLATLVACGGGSPKPTEPSVKTTPAPGPTASSAAVGETEAPLPTEKPAAYVKPAKPPTPFHEFAEGDGDMSVFAAGDTLYVNSGNLVEEVTAKGLEPVFPHEAPEKEGEWQIWGLPGYGRVAEVGGTSRDQTFLTFLTDNGRIGLGLLFRRQGAKWKQIKQLPDGTVYAGLSEWFGGRLLAMTRGTAFSTYTERSQFVIVTGAAAPLPKLTDEKGCPSKILPATYKALPSGEMLVYGSRCENKGEDASYGDSFTGEPWVEYWPAGSSKGTVIRLAVDANTSVPGDFETSAVFGGKSGKDLYLSLGTDADAPHFYRFDGSTFQREDMSVVGRVISMATTEDGVLWAVTSAGGVFSRAPGKPFVEVSLPEGHAAWKVFAKHDGSIWLLTNKGKTSGLLTTGVPAEKVVRIEETKKNDFSLVKPATAKCKSLFIMLYAFTKVTPPDYDFPLTRAAVKGKTRYKTTRFVVTEVGGKKFFGAFVPDLDTGKALVSLVEKEVKGSKPQLVCHEPKVIREIKLNLTTGEVEK